MAQAHTSSMTSPVRYGQFEILHSNVRPSRPSLPGPQYFGAPAAWPHICTVNLARLIQLTCISWKGRITAYATSSKVRRTFRTRLSNHRSSTATNFARPAVICYAQNLSSPMLTNTPATYDQVSTCCSQQSPRVHLHGRFTPKRIAMVWPTLACQIV